MSQNELPTGFRAFEDERRSNWFVAMCSSPIIWGTALTVAFYALIPVMPIPRDLMQRYFCSHWILYAEVWLFGIGLAILAGKAMKLPRNHAAFAYNLARNPSLQQETNWDRRLDLLVRGIGSLPAGVRQTELVRRYCDVGEYVAARRNADGLEDHMKYLHDVAGERLNDSYALTRTIIWAIPILGFLGTVIGITMAIANITPDQLEQSMSEITGGLAVAFDTTALSLSLSMILVFGSFVVERSEQRVLGRVEVTGMREIAPLFASSAASASPLLQAEQAAATLLLERTEKLINTQTAMWQESLDGMRIRWGQVAQKQQTEFTKALQTGMQSTLGQHNSELTAARHEMAATFSKLSTDLVNLVTEVQQRSQQQHATTSQEITSLWKDVQNELKTIRDDQARQVDNLIQSLSNEVLSWQTDMKAATHATTGQVRELHSQGETLLKIVGEEAELSRLQRTLANNLEAIHAVETFEKALHTLTAAVHMLTIKNRAA